MFSNKEAVRVAKVGKCYHVYDRPQDKLKQKVLGRFGRVYRRDFWALQDISFSVKPGEAFGIIGRNGSGKSTLLQIIAGTLKPTTGQIDVAGRVAALLELGSGFNPDFSGRENVYLNGAILGMSRREIDARFDDIAAFADIGDFLDQPVKTYSSGMFVRLAFAVIINLDAQVLLIDEALAVGDVFFRQKCYRRLEELLDRGVAIVLVSHSLNEVEQFCRRAVLLHHGKVLSQGTAAEAVKRYYLVEQEEISANVMTGGGVDVVDDESASQREEVLTVKEDDDLWPPDGAFFAIPEDKQVGNGWAQFTRLAFTNRQGQQNTLFKQGDWLVVSSEIKILRDVAVPVLGVELINEKGVIVHGKSTLEYDTPVPMILRAGDTLRFQQLVALELAVGEYTLNIGMGALSNDDYRQRKKYSYHELDALMLRVCMATAVGQFAIGLRMEKGRTRLLHHGIANLPGECAVSIQRG